MKSSATTKMSSKGQVVIPEELRKTLGLKTGSMFVVVGEDDVVILKLIRPPSMSEFDTIIQVARTQAQTAGLKPADIKKALKAVRSTSS